MNELAIFKALAHPDRLTIMHALASSGPFNVMQLANVSSTSQSQTSQHLIKLRNAGLIVQRRGDNNTIWNSVAPGVVWPLVIKERP